MPVDLDGRETCQHLSTLAIEVGARECPPDTRRFNRARSHRATPSRGSDKDGIFRFRSFELGLPSRRGTSFLMVAAETAFSQGRVKDGRLSERRGTYHIAKLDGYQKTSVEEHVDIGK